MLKRKLKFGVPPCPGGCLYCMVTNIRRRYEKWKKGYLFGLNKTTLFINPPPNGLNLIDLSLLEHDFIGFQGINDPFNPIFENDLLRLIEFVETSKVKKLVLTTKLFPTPKVLKVLRGTKKVAVVVSITGLEPPIEKVPSEKKIDLVYRLTEMGINPYILIHPYIHTVSDLSFLEKLKPVKDKIFVGYKGFRYNRVMDKWLEPLIDPKVLEEYKKKEEDEILVGEDYIEERLREANLTDRKRNFRWYVQKWNVVPYSQPYEEAKKTVEKIIPQAVISSSAPKEEVVKVAIRRRVEGLNLLEV